MIHTCTLTVRSYECDSYGHVNNAIYLHYLEYARCEYLKSIGFDYLAAVASGYGLYVARIEIDYKRPAFPDDVLSIQSWSMKKGAASGVLAQKLFRGADVIAEAKVTWAFVDSSGMPCRIPAEWDLPGLKPQS
jgi:acyl-CoA thioester hydrolase